MPSELQAAKTGNSYDFGSFFARVQPYLSWQDVTLGTLETTIASDKFDETRAPAQLLTAMKNNGFDLSAWPALRSLTAILRERKPRCRR